MVNKIAPCDNSVLPHKKLRAYNDDNVFAKIFIHDLN